MHIGIALLISVVLQLMTQLVASTLLYLLYSHPLHTLQFTNPQDRAISCRVTECCSVIGLHSVIANVSGYDAHCKEMREDVGCAKVLLVSYKTC